MAIVDLEKYKLVELSKLLPAPWNYKKDEPEKIEKLTNNIKRIGQVENLIVRELETGFYEVVNGNHRLEVFKILQTEKAICFDLGKISQAEAQRIAIETNETKFAVDNIKLAQNIKDIRQLFSVEDLVGTMPYTAEQIDNYGKLLDFDFNQFEGDDDEEKKSKNADMQELNLLIPTRIYSHFLEELNNILTDFPEIKLTEEE